MSGQGFVVDIPNDPKNPVKLTLGDDISPSKAGLAQDDVDRLNYVRTHGGSTGEIAKAERQLVRDLKGLGNFVAQADTNEGHSIGGGSTIENAKDNARSGIIGHGGGAFNAFGATGGEPVLLSQSESRASLKQFTIPETVAAADYTPVVKKPLAAAPKLNA